MWEKYLKWKIQLDSANPAYYGGGAALSQYPAVIGYQ